MLGTVKLPSNLYESNFIGFKKCRTLLSFLEGDFYGGPVFVAGGFVSCKGDGESLHCVFVRGEDSGGVVTGDRVEECFVLNEKDVFFGRDNFFIIFS